MSRAAVDTDVLIRLLTGDDPTKQRAARALFERVERGDLELTCPDTVIADAVYVLHSPSLYAQTRGQIRDLLLTLVHLPGFHVVSRDVVVEALMIFAETRLDFGDAMLVASLRARGASAIYSYDRDFDKLENIHRIEPKET